MCCYLINGWRRDWNLSFIFMMVVYLRVCRRGRTIIIIFVGYEVDFVIIVVIVIRVDLIMRFMI